MEVREINIHLKRNFTKWQKFLQFNGIEVFSEKETSSIDKTFVWKENGEILATGTPDEIASNKEVIEAYLGKEDDDEGSEA